MIRCLSLFAIGLLTAAVAAAAPAPRKATIHEARWMVIGSDAAAETVAVKKGTGVIVARIAPRRLFRLEGDVTTKNGFLALRKGTLMVPLADDPKSACELLRSVGSAFYCLTDNDGDGRFDSFFGTQVFQEFFVNSLGDDGGFQPVAPVAWTPVDPKTAAPDFPVTVVYKGLSGQAAKYDVFVQVVRDKSVFMPPSFGKDVKLPIGSTAGVFGSSVELRSVEGNVATFVVRRGVADRDLDENLTRGI